MDEIRADRWFNLVETPAFLAAVAPKERAWWRPLTALLLMAPMSLAFGVLAFLASGVLNTALVDVAVMGRAPHWPASLIAAARGGWARCEACLTGGMTETAMVAMVYLGMIFAVLLSLVIVYRRPARTWLTSARGFRWRLFFVGLLLFGLALALVVSAPEAVHGWPDRPVFLKAGESGRVQIAYAFVMLAGLPIAAAFEELLCRGFLLQATAAFTRSLPAILLVNAVLFSALHVDPDPGRNLSRAALGMALSWAALRTGGLELSIGMHAANNVVITLLVQTLQQGETHAAADLTSVAADLGVALLMVAIAEFAVRWGPLRRLSGLDPDAPPPQPPGVHRANSTLAAP